MKKEEKRMPVWVMIVVDTLLTAAAIGTFMLFDYIMPQSSGTQGTVVVEIDDSSLTQFELPSNGNSQADEQSLDSLGDSSSKSDEAEDKKDESSQSSGQKDVVRDNKGNKYSKVGTDEYSADQNAVSEVFNSQVTQTQLFQKTTENADITITQKSIGEGSDKITYYSADVYVTGAGVIKTALAKDTFGKNIKEPVSEIARRNQAIFAVNGDFYGNAESGVVIRNGVKYRDAANDADVCVLFTDGTMKTYAYYEFDADAVISQGAWQAWNFGPSLLDGQGGVLDAFNTTSYLNSANPRTAIGYVSPGHYVFVTVDGRNEGYSKGVTISELAAIMAGEGCMLAYNLDGGKSAEMYFDGQTVNQPDGGGRSISDIIYIGG